VSCSDDSSIGIVAFIEHSQEGDGLPMTGQTLRARSDPTAVKTISRVPARDAPLSRNTGQLCPSSDALQRGDKIIVCPHGSSEPNFCRFTVPRWILARAAVDRIGVISTRSRAMLSLQWEGSPGRQEESCDSLFGAGQRKFDYAASKGTE